MRHLLLRGLALRARPAARLHPHPHLHHLLRHFHRHLQRAALMLLLLLLMMMRQCPPAVLLQHLALVACHLLHQQSHQPQPLLQPLAVALQGVRLVVAVQSRWGGQTLHHDRWGSFVVAPATTCGGMQRNDLIGDSSMQQLLFSPVTLTHAVAGYTRDSIQRLHALKNTQL
jgi:hypothetical protein